MAENINNKQLFLKKLIYRSKYTGTKETDILLGQFAEKFLPNFSFEYLKLYEKLLESGDPRIWKLSINVEFSKDKKEKEIIKLIQQCGKVINDK